MAPEPRFPEIDFAADPLPNLHEVMAELRASEPVSRIRFAIGCRSRRSRLCGRMSTSMPITRPSPPRSSSIDA